MRQELKNLLMDILNQSEIFNLQPDLLWPKLHLENHLIVDEVDIIKSYPTTTEKMLAIFKFLKPKDERVIIFLQKLWANQGNFDVLNFVKEKLKDFGLEDLIYQGGPLLGVRHPGIESKVESITISLKKHYSQDLKLIENYWRKFDVSGIFKLPTFYNSNFIIKDKYQPHKGEIENVDNLFATDYKQFIICGDAGYGKSMFVHEMAQQWVKGEMEWTKKFLFLFLFRLSEISQSEACSLKTLLKRCLSTQHASIVSKWLENAEFAEKSLFIFDGLDELKQQFCKEIDDIIFGRSAKHCYAISTSRPCQKLENVETSGFFIELKGYTSKGVDEQLMKFSLNPKMIGNDLKCLMKVPLYNMLFCVMHEKSYHRCTNVCKSIEKFIKFTCCRYRNINPNFGEDEEKNLLLTLGQAAQNQFQFIENTDIKYPEITPQILAYAVGIGLVLQKRTKDELIFAHKLVAEYCAALYWWTTSKLTVDKIDKIDKIDKNNIVPSIIAKFSDPAGGKLNYLYRFSRFLSHFSIEYKQFVWLNFEFYAPLLDEYESLPKRFIEKNATVTRFHSESDRRILIKRIEFSSYRNQISNVCMSETYIDVETKIQHASNIKRLKLIECDLKISPDEFFHLYNVKSLKLIECVFYESKTHSEISNPFLNLNSLDISCCDATVIPFLSYIMRKCYTLKTFKLWESFNMVVKNEEETTVLSKFGEGWINDLLTNKKLLFSIEHFQLWYANPADLTSLFEMLDKFVNLKKLILSIERKLTKMEGNILNNRLENGLKNVDCSELFIKMEN